MMVDLQTGNGIISISINQARREAFCLDSIIFQEESPKKNCPTPFKKTDTEYEHSLILISSGVETDGY